MGFIESLIKIAADQLYSTSMSDRFGGVEVFGEGSEDATPVEFTGQYKKFLKGTAKDVPLMSQAQRQGEIKRTIDPAGPKFFTANKPKDHVSPKDYDCITPLSSRMSGGMAY